MPRNPNSPYNPASGSCGPVHTPTNASDNIKLQVLATKLENQLRGEFVQKDNLKKN